MNKVSVLILSVIIAVTAFSRAFATPVPTESAVIVVNGQQYVLATSVPQVAQTAAQAVAKVVPGVNAENLGQTFGATLGGVLQSFGEATGGAVNKTADLTGSAVDKTGDIAGKALDRTFGKDTTLVQGLENLGNTRVGTFAMVLAGWKVMGKDGLSLLKTIQGVLVGVPLQIVLICIYIYILRRFFVTRSVVLSKTGGLFSKERKVEYGLVNVTNQRTEIDGVKVISRIDEDTKHVGLFVSSLVFIVVSSLNIAQVIF